MSKSQQKIKVCCFCERWNSGGIESFLFNVLTRMNRNEIEIDLVASTLGSSVFTESLQERGIQFFELSGNQKNFLENQKRFTSMQKERRWDVLHLNIFHGLSLAYLYIAKQEGIPIRIAHSHNTALRESPTKEIKLAIHTLTKNRFTRYATDLWACSENAADFLFSADDLKKKGFLFIPNGIDVDRFRFNPGTRKDVRFELGLSNQFVVGNVGRFCYQKNQSFLLDVFCEVLKLKSDSYLLLVGEGEDKPLLIEKAQQLGILEKVIFHEVTSCVERLFWAMDVYILPSRFEGLPVTGIEAQATGLPCFFSDAITERCGILKSTKFLPLSRAPEYWAKEILKEAVIKDRSAAVYSVRNAGFDIQHTVQQVESGYRRSIVL